MAKTTLANVVPAGAQAMTAPAAVGAHASRISTSREEVTVEATLPIAPSDRSWTGVTDYHCTNIGPVRLRGLPGRCSPSSGLFVASWETTRAAIDLDRAARRLPHMDAARSGDAGECNLLAVLLSVVATEESVERHRPAGALRLEPTPKRLAALAGRTAREQSLDA